MCHGNTVGESTIITASKETRTEVSSRRIAALEWPPNALSTKTFNGSTTESSLAKRDERKKHA
jgi:hypothetical protein